MIAIKKSASRDVQDMDYLSKENADCLKGICSIAVLIHHVYQSTQIVHNAFLQMILRNLGYLSVAVFFFLSGYGVYVQYKKIGEAYINSFGKKRVIPLYMDSLLLILIYAVVKALVGEPVNFVLIMQSCLFGNTIIKFGWYLQVCVVLYLLFFAVFKMMKEREFLQKFCALIVLVVSLYYSMHFMKISYWWYEGIYAFVLGIYCAEYKKQIDIYVKNTYFPFYLLVGTLFWLFYINYGDLEVSYLTARTTSATLFPVCVMLLLMKIPIRSKLTTFLGKYSFEMYVVQGIAFLLLRNAKCSVANDYTFLVLVITGTILLAVEFKIVLRRYRQLTKSFISKL